MISRRSSLTEEAVSKHVGTIHTKQNQAHRERIMEAIRTVKDPATPTKSLQGHHCRSRNRRSGTTHNYFARSFAASEKSRRTHSRYSSTGRRRRSGSPSSGGAAWSPKRGRSGYPRSDPVIGQTDEGGSSGVGASPLLLALGGRPGCSNAAVHWLDTLGTLRRRIQLR
jgi:hypothetical protein